MRDVLASIARENFRSSGFITQPLRERPSSWTFSAPPRSPSFTTDAVRDAAQRRERAHLKQQTKPSFLPSELYKCYFPQMMF